MENLVRKRIVNIAKVFIGLGLIIFIIYYVEPSKIQETFLKANKIYLTIALLLLPLNLYLQFFKWKILCSEYFGITSNGKIWLSLFYGISGGIFTPMKSGEYFARALPYKDVKVIDVILASLVDKLIPIFFVIIIGGSFFIVYLKSLLDYSTFFTISLVLIFNVMVLLFLRSVFVSSRSSSKLGTWINSKDYLRSIISKISFLKKMDNGIFTKVAIISLLYHLVFTVQMTLMLSAYSGNFQFFLFFFIANLIIFAQIVIPPIALGEIGVREGAAVYFLQYYGYPSAIGFNAAISIFFVNLLFPSIVGLFLLLKRN